MHDHVLQTDRYELSMLQSFIASGQVDKQATFEVFTRKLPNGRRYGVFAGLGRLLPLIENFEFMGEDLKWLREQGMVDRDTYIYLSDFRFTGSIDAYREGELFFPNSPVLTVRGTLGECVVLETLILSILNFDSAIATTAARMVSSAQGRPIIEMGSRRTNEDAAVAAARAAYIAGFASTSNLLAGKRYGVPVVGTAAHAFTLTYPTEEEAFAAQVAAHGTGTTLLVDTYDIRQGIVNAVSAAQVAGAPGPGAIRIDSGDLAYEAQKARELLDGLGATDTRIVVTSDLDEHVLKDLHESPIDGYGVGTRLVASQPMGFVYKLVEIETTAPAVPDGDVETFMRPVAKKSKDKKSVGGRKHAYRLYDRHGDARAEVFSSTEGIDVPDGFSSCRALQDVVMEKGRTVVTMHLEDTRMFHAQVKAELPPGEQKVWSGTFGPYMEAEALS